MRAVHIVHACLAAVCIASAAVVHVVERVLEGFGGFLAAALPSSPPLAFAGDQLAPTASILTFADPHVERHEAGASRRAADRGI